MRKRMKAMLMTAMMLIASIPFAAFAEEEPVEVLDGEVFEAITEEAVEVAEVEEVAEAISVAADSEIVTATENEEVAGTFLGGTPGFSTWAELQAAINDTDGKRGEPAKEATPFILTEDLVATDTDGSLVIGDGKNIILDLGGHILDRGLTEKEAVDKGTVIDIGYGASFTLRDSEGGGMVTGGNDTAEGGGVYVGSNATFTMEGGTISGNKAKSYGGGVYVVSGTGAKVVMTGGTVSGNESYSSYSSCGAGIHFAGNIGTGGRLYVGGNAFVGNNKQIKDGVEITSNAWLVDKLTIGTDENGVPKPDNMSIGFAYSSAPQPGMEEQFTENASEGDEKYFIPDNPKFKVTYNNTGYLSLLGRSISITSDKTSYNIGDQIRLTVTTKFVDSGTVIVITEGTENTWKVSVGEDGTAAIAVNAVKAGSFSYKASIEDLKLEKTKTVTVNGAPKKYFTVTFSTNGGTPVPEEQRVIENGKADRPETNPAKSGYEFAGWYADAGCTNPYNFNMPIDRDITIFAKWTKKSDPTPVREEKEEREPLYTGTWNAPVKSGAWSQDSHGIWHYTSSEMFRQTWAYIYNPYAHDGQHTSDWFWFDRQGNMLTGWQFINGKWYYLHTEKDGVLGSCLIGPAVTPDGWTVDESGAWVESIPRK